MFAACVTTLLCWLAVSASAAPSCEDLLQPLDHLDLQHLKGSWASIAGISNSKIQVNNFSKRESAALIFGDAHNSSAVINVTLAFRENDTCEYVSTTVEFEGSSFEVKKLNEPGHFLKTSCDHCFLVHLSKGEVTRLYLFSRKREVEQDAMEELTAKAACLNMTVPVVRDPTKLLCPEQVSADPTPEAEVKTEGQES